MNASGLPLGPQERDQFAAERDRGEQLKLARQRACPSGQDYGRATWTDRIAARKRVARILGEVDAPSESR